MKTSELTGAALDRAVLEAHRPGLKSPELAGVRTFGPLFGKGYRYPAWGSKKYDPSVSWAEGGLIVEREGITVGPNTRPVMSKGNCAYRAHPFDPEGESQYGPTPLIAAMRCYVRSKLGEEVDVPKELL